MDEKILDGYIYYTRRADHFNRKKNEVKLLPNGIFQNKFQVE